MYVNDMAMGNFYSFSDIVQYRIQHIKAVSRVIKKLILNIHNYFHQAIIHNLTKQVTITTRLYITRKVASAANGRYYNKRILQNISQNLILQYFYYIMNRWVDALQIGDQNIPYFRVTDTSLSIKYHILKLLIKCTTHQKGLMYTHN